MAGYNRLCHRWKNMTLSYRVSWLRWRDAVRHQFNICQLRFRDDRYTELVEMNNSVYSPGLSGKLTKDNKTKPKNLAQGVSDSVVDRTACRSRL